jgi:metal-sulfur cluster biosynthetic enzyme
MTREDVLEALREVDDPEIGINVVDLGSCTASRSPLTSCVWRWR